MNEFITSAHLMLSGNLTQHRYVGISFGNGKLYGYVVITTIFIALVTIINKKGYKNLQAKSNNNLRNEPSRMILVAHGVLSCMILPLLIVVLIPFILIKQVVNIILKIKYGKLFGGILGSSDAVWALDDISKSIINIVVIIKNKSNKLDLTEQLKEVIFHKVFQQPENFPKLTSICLRSMGFNFLLKEQVTVDDCVATLKIRNMDDVLDKRVLQEIVSEYSNQPLPKGNCVLWEVLVSPIPIRWNTSEEEFNTFPILIRFNHIIGDGLSLLNLLLQTFADYTVNTVSNKFISNKTETDDSLLHNVILTSHKETIFKLVATLKYMLNFIYFILIAPITILHQQFMRKEDDNSLHGPHLSGNKILVSAVESDRKLILLVKDIKNSVPGSNFSDILFTAISRSLDEHFRNIPRVVPAFATAVVPILLSPPDMNTKPVLQNQFSVALLDLPIAINSNAPMHRLQEVMKQTKKLRNAPDYHVNYWLLTLLCGVIPHPVLRRSLNADKLTMSISNVPGVSKLSILDGCDIEDIIFYTPHRGTAGVGFSIHTYDDRFQLGLAIDKSLITSIEEAQHIVDDIFKYMESLHEELRSSNVPTKW